MSAHAATRLPTYAILPRGHRIGDRYTIDSLISEGAQGVVYLAHADPLRAPQASPEADSIDGPPSDERVALKVIHRHLTGDPQLAKRFAREAEILRRLAGEHVVKQLDFVQEPDGLLVIALEYVEGISLEARLKEESPLEIREALEIALQICAALGAAHAAGIVHRDLKPANVLIERGVGSMRGPRSLRIKVVDFGLAKVMHSEGATGLTEQGMIFGTPEYMAPEQARGDEADARSDLYAAGVILYEMIVGHVPFHGRSPLGAMTAHLTEAPRSPRDARPGPPISPALEATILRALEKEPLARYRTARAFAEAISAASSEPSVITNAQVPPDDSSAIDDTDLHLAPPTLATAATFPGHDVPDTLRGQLRNIDLTSSRPPDAPPASAAPPRDPPSPGTTLRSAATPSGARRPESASISAVPSTPTPLDDAHTKSHRWTWVAVALIAAAVGVLIGAFAGAR